MKSTLLILTLTIAALAAYAGEKSGESSCCSCCGKCGAGKTTTQVEAMSAQKMIGGNYAKKATGDITDVAMANPNFTTLVAAIKAAGLVETLKGPGPFTVFAPTNDAFAKLPAGTVENLLKPENKADLVALLTYHVLPGKVMAADAKTMAATTVNGKSAQVTVENGKVMIDGATVVIADVKATNGVIHAIDTVIMP